MTWRLGLGDPNCGQKETYAHQHLRTIRAGGCLSMTAILDPSIHAKQMSRNLYNVPTAVHNNLSCMIMKRQLTLTSMSSDGMLNRIPTQILKHKQ
eukprot:scaffold257138_cov20-Prasinocladus_malaysianus.AAC.1